MPGNWVSCRRSSRHEHRYFSEGEIGIAPDAGTWADSDNRGVTTAYLVRNEAASPSLGELAGELGQALEELGFRAGSADDPDLVLNLIDAKAPKPFRRHARGTYVAALHEQAAIPADVLALHYPLLVRALANIVLCYVPGQGVWFTTLEQGCYFVPAENGVGSLARGVAARLAPLARARLVIDNEFRPDLEPELWEGDELTAEIGRAGARLARLDLLPNPFPVEDLLSERDLRHMRRLYGIGGLSYGNLSARKDARRFWMSASGVDKSRLETVGRDILLVSGFDADAGRMILSVPPEVEPRRVSVDATEHWMIYRAHPGVGAILHVHAWVEGIDATEVNFPCGSEEMARGVADLVAAQPDPDHAIVGLRNHGITASGRSLTEILDYLESRIVRQIPMS
jgi:ribulose-5-phosphate 4-epimerase/fuculose-1-phosphate aldolase